MKLAALDEVAVPSLEDVTARVVEHFARGSESSFDAGREVFDYLRASGEQISVAARARGDYKRHRRVVLRSIAAGAGCSTNCIVQHVEVWAAFGEEGLRAEDKAWHWHRALLNAAKRSKESVPDLMDKAIASGWSVADLNTYGRVESAMRRLVAVCKLCGAKVRVDAPRGTPAYDETKALQCPRRACDAAALGTLQ